MRSPGRPSTARREDRVTFWEAIAHGVSSEAAAAEAGVASASGPGGFGRLAAWRRSTWSRCRVAIGRSLNARRSCCSTREMLVCARSAGALAVIRR